MQYSGLTTEQQSVFLSWQNMQRNWCQVQAQANDLGSNVDAVYIGQISPMGITGVMLIPHTDGYAGSQSMTYSGLVTVQSYVEGILASYNDAAHRQTYAQMCGGGNL